MIFQNCLKFNLPNGSNYIEQFRNITHGIYAKYHYKSRYYIYKSDTTRQMMTDALIRGQQTTREVNVSGVLFSPFTKKKVPGVNFITSVAVVLGSKNDSYTCKLHL